MPAKASTLRPASAASAAGRVRGGRGTPAVRARGSAVITAAAPVISPTTSSAWARASCASSGARSGPAGSTQPLPMPRASVDDQHGEILGERRILEAVVHDDDARARCASQPRARDAVARDDGRRDAREQQRLVADIGRRMCAAGRPRPARQAVRHSRASGRTAARRRAISSRAIAIAVGVLPAPPTVEIADADDRHAGARARLRACAAPRPRHRRGERRQQRAASGPVSPPPEGRRTHRVSAGARDAAASDRARSPRACGSSAPPSRSTVLQPRVGDRACAAPRR